MLRRAECDKNVHLRRNEEEEKNREINGDCQEDG